MNSTDEKSRYDQEQILSEFAVVFLVIFLLIHFAQGKQDVEQFKPWFIMFCSVRLMLAFFFIESEKSAEQDASYRKHACDNAHPAF